MMFVLWLIGTCLAMASLVAYGSWRVCKNDGDLLGLFRRNSSFVTESDLDVILNVFFACFFSTLLCAAWMVMVPAAACWFFGKCCYEAKKQKLSDPAFLKQVVKTVETDENGHGPWARQTIVGDNNVQVAGDPPVAKKKRGKKQQPTS